LLDFGMVIKVPSAHQKAWAACIVHLVRGKYEAVLDCLIEIGFFPADCPRDVVLPTMSRIWREMVACGSDTAKRKEAVKNCFDEITTLVRSFEFDLPRYYLALVRAMLTLEGTALAADCDFDIFEAAFPVALRAMQDNVAVTSAVAAEVTSAYVQQKLSLQSRSSAVIGTSSLLLFLLVARMAS